MAWGPVEELEVDGRRRVGRVCDARESTLGYVDVDLVVDGVRHGARLISRLDFHSFADSPGS